MPIRLKKPRRRDNPGEKWGSCVKCGYGVADDANSCARRYPQSQLVWWKGKLYCDVHMSAKKHEMMDEADIFIDEGDRGEPI